MKNLQLFIDNNSKYIKATQNEINELYKDFLTNITFKPNLSGDVLKNLYYTFRFRDWSKEALMDLAESLIVETKPKTSNSQEYRIG